MNHIRNRLIVIFLLLVLLPAVPISLLVINLVHQSYQIGVNPQVEEALTQAVEHSRQLYQLRKNEVALQLQTLIREEVAIDPPALAAALPDDNSQWRFLSLQVYNRQGKLLNESFHGVADTIRLNSSHFTQLIKSPSPEILIANRVQNRFHAIHIIYRDNQRLFLVLNAAMSDQFLRDTDRILQVHQTYQRLILQPEFVPTRFLYAFFLIGFLFLVLAVGLALLLSRRITRPVDHLMAGAEAIGRGDLEYRIPESGNDEFGKLIRQFNRMTADLKESQERTIYLEKMAAWQGIARRLAHEIKNPLTPIQLTVQEMVDQYQGKDEGYLRLLRECHQIIHEEIENLRKLVKEFSEFGRLPELHKAGSNLHQLIEETSLLYSHLPLQLSLDAEYSDLQLDEDRIRRVLINLIENAAQAAGSEKPIKISTYGDRSKIYVSVKDDGPGISREMLARVFEPYFSTKSEGVGLGLAISRKMVEEHGGSITVSSKINRGAEFCFVLPIANEKKAE